jgi:hypothetical protein
MRVKVALTFKDGRAPRTEIVRVHGEATKMGLSEGAWLQLLDFVIRELGPQRIGLFGAGTGRLLAYETRKGAAVVTLPGPADDASGRQLRDPRVIFDDDSFAAQDAANMLRAFLGEQEKQGNR